MNDGVTTEPDRTLGEPQSSESRCVRLGAVGDVLLTPPPDGTPYLRDADLVAGDLRAVFADCDLVFGNLECTLAGQGQVPTEPRVFTTPELVRAVQAAGFGLVTIANNHTFDGLESGFQKLRAVLEEIGLPYFGAGMDLQEATAPAILTVKGLQLAFLAGVDERSGPSHFAGPGQWGVAPLHIDRLVGQIRELRSQADHVIVSVHWGDERFSIPSPVQIHQARTLVDAGASLVLGHHPHVVQGLELWGGGAIIYSLGNFIGDEVYFSNGDAVRWNRTERIGCFLVAELTANGVANVRQRPTYDSGRLVQIDDSRRGQRRIDQTRRALARGVTTQRYRREHLRVKTIMPALQYLHWAKLSSIRPRHFRKALSSLLSTREPSR